MENAAMDARIYKMLTNEETEYPPPFSTEIACAWSVVDALKKDGWDVTIRARAMDDFVVAVGYPGAYYSAIEAFGPNVAQAICVAAIRISELPPI